MSGKPGKVREKVKDSQGIFFRKLSMNPAVYKAYFRCVLFGAEGLFIFKNSFYVTFIILEYPSTILFMYSFLIEKY